MKLDAFYLASENGSRFCLFHHPEPGVKHKGGVVYVHPFGEEMNKSRRMAALQSKKMASAGYSVLQIDLFGCGDSSGDFGDASWTDWVADVKGAALWLLERGSASLWFWGLRTGCLIAAEAAENLDLPINLLMWHPVISGKVYLQQFLRLKIAGEMLGGSSKNGVEELRAALAAGISVEIGGYSLSGSLAEGLGKAELNPSQNVARIELIELSSKTTADLSPSASARLAKWQTSGGCLARGSVVHGPAFWQTAEISECPDLLDATIRSMVDPEI